MERAMTERLAEIQSLWRAFVEKLSEEGLSEVLLPKENLSSLARELLEAKFLSEEEKRNFKGIKLEKEEVRLVFEHSASFAVPPKELPLVTFGEIVFQFAILWKTDFQARLLREVVVQMEASEGSSLAL